MEKTFIFHIQTRLIPYMNNIVIIASSEGAVWLVILTAAFLWGYRDTLKKEKEKDKENHQ